MCEMLFGGATPKAGYPSPLDRGVDSRRKPEHPGEMWTSTDCCKEVFVSNENDFARTQGAHAVIHHFQQ
ncbi:hypothetical protein BQ8794_20038 [Mesorhizobium prunaredense]|uniref:Uncharacterized protein n=1 Tax=Mesorhizobium prunaredense TaxID=1631249 RepID=A0A1R3V517_9HYPH|nr:hypothetical protein BQ8794_20038 [Mesorhizobium prunaredense]